MSKYRVKIDISDSIKSGDIIVRYYSQLGTDFYFYAKEDWPNPSFPKEVVESYPCTYELIEDNK